MPQPIELELIRALWKFCFKLENADTQANRKINVETLAILYHRNPVAFRELVDTERPTFSNVGPDAAPLDALIDFLADHGPLYGSLDSSAHILIDGRIDADINNRAKATFKAPDMAAHLAALDAQDTKDLAQLDEKVWLQLLADAEAEGHVEKALAMAVKIYTSSGSYDAADARFAKFIEPILSKLTSPTMTQLLEGIEDNSQTYGRGRAALDHPQVKSAADALGVDTTPFTAFTMSL